MLQYWQGLTLFTRRIIQFLVWNLHSLFYCLRPIGRQELLVFPFDKYRESSPPVGMGFQSTLLARRRLLEFSRWEEQRRPRFGLDPRGGALPPGNVNLELNFGCLICWKLDLFKANNWHLPTVPSKVQIVPSKTSWKNILRLLRYVPDQPTDSKRWYRTSLICLNC